MPTNQVPVEATPKREMEADRRLLDLFWKQWKSFAGEYRLGLSVSTREMIQSRELILSRLSQVSIPSPGVASDFHELCRIGWQLEEVGRTLRRLVAGFGASLGDLQQQIQRTAAHLSDPRWEQPQAFDEWSPQPFHSSDERARHHKQHDKMMKKELKARQGDLRIYAAGQRAATNRHLEVAQQIVAELARQQRPDLA